MERYLFFERRRKEPARANLIGATSPLEALNAYVSGRIPEARFTGNGEVTVPHEGKLHVYPHPLALIEARCKRFGEWQMRRIPDRWFYGDPSYWFCGERAPDVQDYFSEYRRHLQRLGKSESRPGFLWYLNFRQERGPLLCFYRTGASGNFQVEKRILVVSPSRGEYVPWQGSYDEILTEWRQYGEDIG